MASQNRRRFVATLSSAGAAAILGTTSSLPQERPLETTIIRIAKNSTICIAPQYVADDLLRAEGFTDIQYVERAPAILSAALGRGEVDFSLHLSAPSIVAIDAVMKQTGGKWPGAEEFIKRLAGVKVDAVRGPVSLDDMRNPIQNIYIKKVEKKKMFGYDKEELWNTVIKTYPNVSQFWKYSKAAFLTQPVYSRDYPACRFC